LKPIVYSVLKVCLFFGLSTAFLGVTEFGARAVLWLKGYDPETGSPISQRTTAEQSSPIGGLDELKRETAKFVAKGEWRFSEFSMYDNSLWDGQAFSIGKMGTRDNGQQADKNVPEKRIWMFGDSVLMALDHKGETTIPGYLESRLDEATPEFDFKVINFGVSHYKSTHQLLKLYKLLEVEEPPEVVVFICGATDYLAGLPGRVLVSKDARLEAAKVTHIVPKVLELGWRNYQENKIILREGLRAHVSRFFPGLSNVITKYESWRLIRVARAAPNKWKSHYRHLRDQVYENFDNYVTDTNTILRKNIYLAAALGDRYGFKVIIAAQPFLLNSKKMLTDEEIELLSFKNNHQVIAMTDHDLDQLHEIPAYLIDLEVQFLPAEKHTEAYGKIISSMRDEIAGLSVTFVNLQKVIDDIGPIPAFTDFVHLTAAAHDAIAGKLEQEVIVMTK